MQEQIVHTKLGYVPDDGLEIWFYDPGPEVPRRNMELAPERAEIHDARAEGFAPKLDREGFELVPCDADIAFAADPAEVRARYYPAIERLVKEHTGAARVIAFDHDFRSSDVADQNEHLRPAVMGAHVDYTENSGPQRVRELLPDEADTLLKKRFAFINVWKPIGRPAEETPLAFCDVSTVSPGDLVTIYLRYRDRSGEIYGIKRNPHQRWSYFRDMRPDEAVLLKCYDSDKSVSRFTPHGAFEDPTSRKDAPARRSIEVRTIAFFD
jgi:hypothetical protein